MNGIWQSIDQLHASSKVSSMQPWMQPWIRSGYHGDSHKGDPPTNSWEKDSPFELVVVVVVVFFSPGTNSYYWCYNSPCLLVKWVKSNMFTACLPTFVASADFSGSTIQSLSLCWSPTWFILVDHILQLLVTYGLWQNIWQIYYYKLQKGVC